jgi:hypothetical protein
MRKMPRRFGNGRPRAWLRKLAAVMMAAVWLGGLSAEAAEPKLASLPKSWPEMKAEFKKGIPKKWDEMKENVARLKVTRRPKTTVSSYEAAPELWTAVTSFYDFIQGRELDVIYEQPGIPDFFPDRDAYYNFLDTMLPAMRDRRFERNRVLAYKVHEISASEETPDEATVVMSITSDDALPFKKVMIFREQWVHGPKGWYPGKITADPATYWERIR